MVRFALALSLLITGCMWGTDWDDVPGARVRAVNQDPDVTDEQWTFNVQLAIDEWNGSMRAVRCPEPFDPVLVASGAHPVRLIAAEDWTDEVGDGEAGQDGLTYGDGPGLPAGGIDIRSDTGWHGALLHELGHALGLGHAPADPPSVMCDSSGCSADHVTPVDVAAAACALGCGGCS